MKHKIFIPLILVAAILIATFGFASVSATQPSESKAAPNPEMIKKAKIESILNLNNVFDDDFTDNQTLVNRAVVNLKSYADEDGFIPESIVITFIKDMYDIDLVITDDINADLPHKAGFVYLVPKGYTSYKHNIASIEDNGEFITVKSDVSARYHDGEALIGSAETIIVKNSASPFGYNIIDCRMNFNDSALLTA